MNEFKSNPDEPAQKLETEETSRLLVERLRYQEQIRLVVFCEDKCSTPLIKETVGE